MGRNKATKESFSYHRNLNLHVPKGVWEHYCKKIDSHEAILKKKKSTQSLNMSEGLAFWIQTPTKALLQAPVYKYMYLH